MFVQQWRWWKTVKRSISETCPLNDIPLNLRRNLSQSQFYLYLDNYFLGFGVTETLLKILLCRICQNIHLSIHFMNVFLGFAGFIVEQTFSKARSARSAVRWCSLCGVKTFSVLVQSVPWKRHSWITPTFIVTHVKLPSPPLETVFSHSRLGLCSTHEEVQLAPTLTSWVIAENYIRWCSL